VFTLAVSTVDLARIQFATTSIYHFFFVPLTLGLAPLVAWMQTKWHRSGDERWLRLTHFFGTLLLINFAIGVATGLVQEFQFGMNWSVYSNYVGGVFGAPLAIEGLAAFFLESTFLGLWIFGWNKLSPRLHLATAWAFTAGTWLSAYFILVANSWMQDPVGYKIQNGVAQLTNIGDLLANRFALYAFGHTIMAGLTAGSLLVFGVSCWHILRNRNVDLFMLSAKLALIVALPITFINLGFGSRFGIITTEDQPMKIAAAEALWNTQQPASFSLFQIGGFSASHPDPSFQIAIPGLLSFLSTGSFNGKVEGLNQLQQQYSAKYGKGVNYVPLVRLSYWSMRVMAYVGTLMFLLAAIGAWLVRKRRLHETRWFLWAAVVGIFLPYLSTTFGWLLTEGGRQPWIVQGLLLTAKANSPGVSSATIAVSLTAFVLLYIGLAIADVKLMRRYARVDPKVEEAAAY
jgi:cytochrome d ubiquinol oxidase subunit I